MWRQEAGSNCSHADDPAHRPAGHASDHSVGRAHGKEQVGRVLHHGHDLTPNHDDGTGTGTGTGHDRASAPASGRDALGLRGGPPCAVQSDAVLSSDGHTLYTGSDDGNV